MSYRYKSAGSILAALLTMVAPKVLAQQTAVTTPPPSDKDESIVLSPFVVSASEDAGSYSANSTLAGTRVRTDLRDTASAISVVTQQFLQDTGATNAQDLLVYTPSTEVGGIGGNFSGAAGHSTFTESTNSPSTRVRGLDSADNTRDYYLTDIPFDTFNVGRVDLQRGPNSILFGVGSPAGIVNASTNAAGFKNEYKFENRFDQFGSFRNSAEVNYVLVPDMLSIRVAALVDDKKFEQKPAFNNTNRYYAALRFDPKLFKSDTAHTSIRANFETGKVHSNNPRDLPPVDDINRWFAAGPDAYGNLGYNKLTINQYNLANPNPSGVPMPGFSGSSLPQATYELGGNAETRSYWPDIINYYQIGSGGTPIQSIAAEPNTGKGLVDKGNGAHQISGVAGFRPFGIPDYSQAQANIGTSSVGTQGGFTYPQKAVPGGAYFADVVLQDPSIFDFYHKLLDGPNKHEWQDWRAENVAIDQTFFDDRLAFELSVDHQYFNSGDQKWLAGQDYNINVDVNQTYADGSANPNVGRPYVGDAESNQNFESTSIRDTVRFTVTADLRAEDILGKTTLAGILGHHILTGLYDRSKHSLASDQYALYATTPQYSYDNNLPGADGQISSNSINSSREYDWINYLGPSMLSTASASGLHLGNIPTVLAPPHTQTIRNFDSTWNKPTDPTAAGYVDPNAAYVYTNKQTGQPVTSYQSDNPANYVGWTNESITWMSANNPADKPQLITSASRVSTRDISKGLTWQGYFLNGDLVPVYGWRKDHVTTLQAQSNANIDTGIAPLTFANPGVDETVAPRADVAGTSHTWGGVYHLPKALTDHLPWGSTLSFFYNHGNNFEADASRLSVAGLPIPNPQGVTKEYGVTFTTLHDKVSLKVSHFNTVVRNATLSNTNGNDIAGLGNNGYFLADGVIWGYGWTTALQDGINGKTPGTNYWDYANADGLPNTTPAEQAAYKDYNLNGGTFNGKTYVGANNIIKAWLSAPLPAGYFSSFGLSPAIDPTVGAKSGNLADSYGSTGPNDQNGPNTGGGSDFGNHQITVDNLSKGVEIELSAQPVKNWNFTFNYVHVKATHENIDQAAQDFIGKMTAFMNGPGGQVREWYNGGGTLGAQWDSSIVAPFTVELDSLGHEAPEISPWRVNAVTTYNFDHGALKGVFVGGGLRIDAARIIGYYYDAKFKNVNSNDPNYAAVAAVTQGGLDIDDPIRGKNETHLDAWVGYQRKLTHKLNWRIQLNMRNVGEHDHLIASQDNPGDRALNIAPSVALARISPGMTWQLTNSIEF